MKLYFGKEWKDCTREEREKVYAEIMEAYRVREQETYHCSKHNLDVTKYAPMCPECHAEGKPLPEWARKKLEVIPDE